MEKKNGESGIDVDDIPTRQLVEIIAECVQQITEKLDELIEKVHNISTPGVDYGEEG